jgi:hypothetical protein
LRTQATRDATSHLLYRAVGGVLDRVTVVAGPTVVEEAEAVVY